MKYLFEEQVQSYKETPEHEIKQNHILTVNIVVADVIIGGAEPEDDEENLEFTEQCRNTKSIRMLKNIDNYCLVRAILLGKHYADKEDCKNLLRGDQKGKLNREVAKKVKD